jgi:hypothetical protein
MLALTWRQFRANAAVALGVLVAVALTFVVTHGSLEHLYRSGVVPCRTTGNCDAATSALLQHHHVLQGVADALVLGVPLLIAMFWGAPLVARELETGTFRLAWTQSVTRTRWLVAKLAVAVAASMLVAGLLSLVVTWWIDPIDRVQATRFDPFVFAARDIVPIGYAAFACMLGATAGLLLRRFVPAMATSLVAFVVVRLAVTYWIRPQLAAPAHRSYALGALSRLGFVKTPSGLTFSPGNPPDIPNGLVLSSHLADHAGTTPTPEALQRFVHQRCPRIAVADPTAFNACVAKLSARFHEVVAYQPASRYWTFQWYETGIFLALSLVLAGVCLWSIRRLG